MKLNVLKNEVPVLGSFGKGVDGSYSLNFGTSSGKNCDRSCPHHSKSTAENPTNACYATRSETYRIGLRDRLARHERRDPARLVLRALDELQRKVAAGRKEVKWLRLSVSGSVPQPHKVTPTFRQALRDLFDFCEENNIPVHFPVETSNKARFYRRIVGGRAVVRESCHTVDDFIRGNGQVSVVGGNREMNKQERLDESKRIAKLRTESTGRKAVVCPAVAAKYYAYINARKEGLSHREASQVEGSPNAKCGNCTCCADAAVDIIYPLH